MTHIVLGAACGLIAIFIGDALDLDLWVTVVLGLLFYTLAVLTFGDLL